ncbi:hypothetical protein GCM10011611_03180 [Aliidongia dinghuensis]|uniref:Uncharacterized protein n=2 Tax=Aliidongia dinghuensis TaxID=1867774 RepID=A0A8J2YPQ7_9PROT|nr:hypothetical protein GCM10011611_03180 [Aliidongia dinghuensis]
MRDGSAPDARLTRRAGTFSSRQTTASSSEAVSSGLIAGWTGLIDRKSTQHPYGSAQLFVGGRLGGRADALQEPRPLAGVDAARTFLICAGVKIPRRSIAPIGPAG